MFLAKLLKTCLNTLNNQRTFPSLQNFNQNNGQNLDRWVKARTEGQRCTNVPKFKYRFMIKS